jgi:hypothetical protein
MEAVAGAAIAGALVAGLKKTRIAFPWPVGGMVKIPGALGTTDTKTGGEALPLTSIKTSAVAEVCPAAKTSNGTCALT